MIDITRPTFPLIFNHPSIFSSVVVLLVMVIIGNFSISDAELRLEHAILPESKRVASAASSVHNYFDGAAFISNINTSVQSSLHFSTQSPEHCRFIRSSDPDITNSENGPVPISTAKRRLFLPVVNYYKRKTRSVDDTETSKGKATAALQKQFVIRALTDPIFREKLLKTFEKVDSVIKTVRFSKSKDNIQHLTRSSPSFTPHSQGHLSNQFNHYGEKFIYHRVQNIDATGIPTQRGIAAVVSLESTPSDSNSKIVTVNSSDSLKKYFPVSVLYNQKLKDGFDKTAVKLAGTKHTDISVNSQSIPNFLRESHSTAIAPSLLPKQNPELESSRKLSRNVEHHDRGSRVTPYFAANKQQDLFTRRERKKQDYTEKMAENKQHHGYNPHPHRHRSSRHHLAYPRGNYFHSGHHHHHHYHVPSSQHYH